MTAVSQIADVPVRKTVTVKTSAERAFKVFTDGFDSWWPKSHHIGAAPLERSVIEGRVGGRCYGHSVDGVDYPWGTILVWEPPRRFVMAWQITPEWKFEPDIEKSSEVEVTFTALPEGTTRVDLEHRRFDRYGAGGESLRQGVSGDGGWGNLLKFFVAEAEKESI